MQQNRDVFYRPQTKLLEGNVFTPGCDSVHRGDLCPVGGVSLSREVSVQEWGLCPGVGSLSKSGVSVQEWGLLQE